MEEVHVCGVFGDPDILKAVIFKELHPEFNCSFKLFKYSKKESIPGQVTLTLSDGSCILSSNEICRYLYVKEFGEMAPLEQALLDYWFEWETISLKSAVQASIVNKTASDELLLCMSQLEAHLVASSGRIVASNKEEFSLADIIIWTTLFVIQSPECSFSSSIGHQYPQVASWFRMLARNTCFSTGVWTASDDRGYEAYYNYIMHQLTDTKPKMIIEKAIPSNSSGQKKHKTVSAPIVSTTNAPVVDDSMTGGDTVSQNEIEEAVSAWNEGSSKAPKPHQRIHPILPVPGERNILVTSALPYVNNVPHLGNIIGCVLSGDVFVRFARLRNYNTLYVCGTDEYGTATEVKALKEGLTPQEICDKYYDIHSQIYKWFNIDFDIFGRTSTPQQTQISQDIFWCLYDKGLILKDTMDQLLCTKCDKYLADRFVEGVCPLCSYPDARGDQCDKCGKLINAVDLKSPRCSICRSSPIVKRSHHLFLDLEKLEPSVLDWSQKSSKEGIWSQNAQHITGSWIRDGLKPRCITRDLKWGTPVPLEGYTDKVFYVWFDAPIGYLSITACYTDQWEQWWKNPKEVQLYQFMAKDNVPFHTVVFPSTLIGTGVNYTLLNHISSTEYLNYEDGKFSKSRGIGVFGNDARDTGIPPDVYRFYLLYVRPESQDSAFSWSDFVTKNNSELLNNLGNFINRTLSFIKSSFDSIIPEVKLTANDQILLARITQELHSYIDCLEKQKIRDGIKHILSISRLGNGHIQAHKPWEMIKGNFDQKQVAGSLLGLCANVVCLLSVLLQPYMPSVSEEIQAQLKVPPDVNIIVEYFVPFLKPGHKIGQPYPLFKKIDDVMATELKKRFGGQNQQEGELSSELKSQLESQLATQAELVRSLKSKDSTASKETIDTEVAKLLALKAQLGISSGGAKSKNKKGRK